MAINLIDSDELRERASDILRRVSKDGDSFEIALEGQIVARLVPAEPVERKVEIEAWLQRWETLGAEISAHWQYPQDAVQAIREQRRDL